jgi:hypothetical protein
VKISVHGSTGLTKTIANSVTYPFALSLVEGLLRAFTQSGEATHLAILKVLRRARFFVYASE